MALGTFSDLKSSIQNWMFDRSDLAPQCDDFIALCEADINHVLRARRQMTTAMLVLDADSQAELPADYLEFRNVTALTTPRRRLDMVTPGYADDAYPFREASCPSVFTIENGTITVLPKTSADIELDYFAKIPALSEDEPANWLLLKLPNIYLYGSLKHAAVYIGQNERAATFGGLFNGLLQALIRDERSAVWSTGRSRVSGRTP